MHCRWCGRRPGDKPKQGDPRRCTGKCREVAAAALWLVLLLGPVAAADQGFFGCFHLDEAQQKWFSTPGVGDCCRLGDGMPIRFEDRADGTYILPYEYAWGEARACRDAPSGVGWDDIPHPDDIPRSGWQKVGDQIVLRKDNPVGVGIVWWANASYPGVSNHEMRCFIGLSKV